MISARLNIFRGGSLAASLVLLQLAFSVSPARGQQGIFLQGLGESAQNVDVTESGGSPTATVTITCCQPDGVTPVTAMHGTQGEAVENLINDLVIFDGTPPNFTKWNDLQGGNLAPSPPHPPDTPGFMIPVEIMLTEPRAVNYYTLTSANDAPERDPWEWRFLGTNVANPTPADFVLIEARTEVDFPNRHQTQLFGPLGNTTEYTTYRFEFETQLVAQRPDYPAGLPIPNSIQLAEVELFEDFAGGGAKLTINRGSNTAPSTMMLTNAGTSPLNIIGYSITSPGGTLNSNAWQSIAENSDGDDGGELDSDIWIRLTEPNGRHDLSEVESPNGTNGVSINPSASIDLGNNAWIKHPTEDVAAEILLADGTTQSVSVTFTGAVPYKFGDLNFDRAASLTFADWIAFKNGQGFDFATAFSAAESYGHGDLDGDFDHDLDDFRIFKSAFDAANGAGAFVAMLAAVPEPGTAALLGIAALVASGALRRRGTFLVLIGLVFLLSRPQASQAQTVLPGLVGGDLTNPDNAGPPDVLITAGSTSPANEGPAQALDNNTGTKWLAFEPNGTFYQVRFLRNSRSAVNEYTITSANDAEERDPYSWTLSGSNDGTNFTVVDTRSAQDFTARFQTQQFTFSNTTAYNYYQFDFMTSLGAGVPTEPAPNSIQLAEIELFGTPLVPVLLTLEVDAAMGTIRIANNNTLPDSAIDFDAYSIRSPSGSLNVANWWGAGPAGAKNGGQSIHDQTIAGFPSGNGTGNGWEEGTFSSNNELREYYLGTGGVGVSTLSPGEEITMNNVFQVGGAQDLTFEYNSAGATVQGIVEYLGVGPGLQGDYNNDNSVDAADYVVWRKTDGTTAGYNTWRMNFGRTAGSGSALGSGSAVPEPAAGTLALFIPGLLLLARRRSPANPVLRGPLSDSPAPVLRSRAMANAMRNGSRLGSTGLALMCVFLINSALGSTVDRDYKFGDDTQENAAAGAIVGSGDPPGSADTLDSAAQGSFFDLFQHGGPTYVNTSASGRPGAGETGDRLGIQFTGSSSQYLDGAGFGAPREGGALASPPVTDYPSTRIMQVWARPTVDTGARQDVVNDTFQFGIHITPTDTWGHTYGATAGVGNVFNTGAPVAYNEWTHIMQRTFDAGGVAVYVNGVAVSRFNAGYVQTTAAADDRNIYVAAGLGGASNFFTGQLDNLQLSVAGIFIPQPPNQPIPVDWGPFNLGTDNDYIANLGLVAGDVNGDGVVNGTGAGPAATDDVRFFIDHWLDERRVNNFVIGDLVSRTQHADLNFDGRTTLADWAILRSNHAAGASLDLGALLAGVPEPSTALLAGLAVMAACGWCRRRPAP